MNKGTFILYDIDLESIDYLSDPQVSRLFRAIIKYRLKGITPDFSDDAALKIIFHQISEHIALNEKKYKETCKKNSESAKKRWANQKGSASENQYKDMPKHTRACENIQSDANLCLYDTDTVTDTETDTGTVNVTDTVNDTDACGAKRENKRKNYYNKKKDVPILLRDEPAYDVDAFMRKAIGIKYKKPEVTP